MVNQTSRTKFRCVSPSGVVIYCDVIIVERKTSLSMETLKERSASLDKMYHILDQRNIQQSFGYDPLIGPYISTIIHDRKFIRDAYGPWREIYPVFPSSGYHWDTANQHQSSHQHQPSPTFPNQMHSSPKQSPNSNFSQSQSTEQPFTLPKSQNKYSNLPSPRTRHYVPGMTEEELEEKRKEAGWYPGCESEEEEEEPDFWEFIKNLSKETEERMAESLREFEEEEENENYFIASFDFH